MVATRRRQRCSALGQARTTVSCLLSYESRATRDPCTRDQASYPPERLVDWAAARYAFRCKVGPKGKREDEKWSRDAWHLGSCLCGAVRFEVEGGFQRFYLCHCGHCRKDSGSAHAANLFASGANLRWVTGKDQVRCFTLPSTRHSKCF